ncbi:hypothetical protein ACFL35_08765 [Candidatus Riflebacteria bacterium]
MPEKKKYTKEILKELYFLIFKLKRTLDENGYIEEEELESLQNSYEDQLTHSVLFLIIQHLDGFILSWEKAEEGVLKNLLSHMQQKNLKMNSKTKQLFFNRVEKLGIKETMDAHIKQFKLSSIFTPDMESDAVLKNDGFFRAVFAKSRFNRRLAFSICLFLCMVVFTYAVLRENPVPAISHTLEKGKPYMHETVIPNLKKMIDNKYQVEGANFYISLPWVRFQQLLKEPKGKYFFRIEGKQIPVLKALNSGLNVNFFGWLDPTLLPRNTENYLVFQDEYPEKVFKIPKQFLHDSSGRYFVLLPGDLKLFVKMLETRLDEALILSRSLKDGHKIFLLDNNTQQ